MSSRTGTRMEIEGTDEIENHARPYTAYYIGRTFFLSSLDILPSSEYEVRSTGEHLTPSVPNAHIDPNGTCPGDVLDDPSSRTGRFRSRPDEFFVE
jgi:hypothetical protein